MRADEVRGKSLMNLDIGLPVQELMRSIRSCLTGESDEHETVLEAVNRRGKPIKCRVYCSRFSEEIKNGNGAILFVEEFND